MASNSVRAKIRRYAKVIWMGYTHDRKPWEQDSPWTFQGAYEICNGRVGAARPETNSDRRKKAAIMMVVAGFMSEYQIVYDNRFNRMVYGVIYFAGTYEECKEWIENLKNNR